MLPVPISIDERQQLEQADIKYITSSGSSLLVPKSGKVFVLRELEVPAVGIFGDYIGFCTYVTYMGFINGVFVAHEKVKIANPTLKYVFLASYNRRRAFKRVYQTLK